MPIAVRPRAGASSSRLPAGPGPGHRALASRRSPRSPATRGPRGETRPRCPSVLPVQAPKARETGEPRSACGGPRGRAGPRLQGTGALAAVQAPPPCLARGNGPPPPPWLRREETSSSILWDLVGELGAHRNRTPGRRGTWPRTAPTALHQRPCPRRPRACVRLGCGEGHTTVRGPGAAAGSRGPPSGLRPRGPGLSGLGRRCRAERALPGLLSARPLR